MKIFNAENIVLGHLMPSPVIYSPKSLRTEALQVTRENIGKLTLEFESEIFEADPGQCYIRVNVERTNDHGTQYSISRTWYISDWIVPLWGELHWFQDDVFKSTFEFVEQGNTDKSAWDFHNTVVRGVVGPAIEGELRSVMKQNIIAETSQPITFRVICKATGESGTAWPSNPGYFWVDLDKSVEPVAEYNEQDLQFLNKLED
jgi:hypothetical protein